MFTPALFVMLSGKLRPVYKQAQLFSGLRKTQITWRHKMQSRAGTASAATFHLLDDCLGELNVTQLQP